MTASLLYDLTLDICYRRYDHVPESGRECQQLSVGVEGHAEMTMTAHWESSRHKGAH